MDTTQLQRPLQTATHWGAYLPELEKGSLVKMKSVDYDPDPSRILKAGLMPMTILSESVSQRFEEAFTKADLARIPRAEDGNLLLLLIGKRQKKSLLMP